MSEENYWTRLQRRSVSRRTMLRGAAIGGAGLAGAALIGCGDDDDDDGGGGEPAPAAGGGGQTAPAATVDPDGPRAGGPIRYPTTQDAHHCSARHPGTAPPSLHTSRRVNPHTHTPLPPLTTSHTHRFLSYT